VLNTLISPDIMSAYPRLRWSLTTMFCCKPSIDVSNRSIGPVGAADSETTYSRHRGGGEPRAVPPSMPLAYNLLAEALNVTDIGSNGNAMAVVSGGGPVGDKVAGWDILRGCGGVLLSQQPARIAVSAIAIAQHNCRFRMEAIVAAAGFCCAHFGADAAPLRAAPMQADVRLTNMRRVDLHPDRVVGSPVAEQGKGSELAHRRKLPRRAHDASRFATHPALS
jgi:hypothetical protein